MGNKPWVDEEKPSPIFEFIGSSIAGFLTLLISVGWIPIHFGMNKYLVLILCVAGGLALGVYMAREAMRNNQQNK